MKAIMYVVALFLVGWLVLAAKEFSRFMAADWNNLKAAGMQDKEAFLAEQERVHAQYYNGEKRYLTYPRIVFLKQMLWILPDMLAACTLHSAGLAPDDYVGIANLLIVSYMTAPFMVYGDYYFTFLQLSIVHNKEDYSVEKLEAFYDAQQINEERVAPVAVLAGFRLLRFVVVIAAIASIFLA